MKWNRIRFSEFLHSRNARRLGWRRWAALCGCLAVFGTGMLIQTRAQTAGGFGSGNIPTAIHTNRVGFRIPYQYDPHEIQRLGAREIRLFRSVDRGANWQHVQSVAPATGRFDFQANADGEYWFSVQTVDAQGQLHPGGDLTPGLAVVVDTQNPKLQIDLREKQPGKVELSWNASDPSLAVETLRLEFTQSGQADWQAVAAAQQPNGQTVWTVPSGGMVSVRGQVQDKAGNVARSQYQVEVRPSSAGGAFQSPAPPPPGPVAGLPGGALPAFPGTALGPAAPAPLLPGQTAATGNAPSPFGPAFGPSPVAPTPGRFNDPFAPTTPLNGLPNSVATTQPTSPNLSGIPFNVGVPNQWTPETNPQFRSVSDRPSHRTVSTRRFQVDYRIDDIGPSGIAAVELYVTQNDGQKWFRYGVDEDRRSPFEIEVPGDGMYGFMIRVVSGAGLSDAPPQPGQKPDIVVVVDSSPPVVQLYPLRQGQGRESNRILITWQAADHQLADLPIALSYSANPNGPWEPIVQGWQANTGNYIWNVSPNVPPRLFVRLIAKDSAGNLAKVDTPQPVLVDLAKPTARIVDVESHPSGQRGTY